MSEGGWVEDGRGGAHLGRKRGGVGDGWMVGWCIIERLDN